jgi:hypothetical protein
MGLAEVFRVVGRHWVALTVPLSYQSAATMIVLPPNTADGGSGPTVKVNPYAGVGAQSTQVAASAVAQVANGEQFLEAERNAGVTSAVTVQVATLYGGGVVLDLTATSPHAAQLTGDLRVVSRLVSDDLQNRQVAAGAPAGSLLTVNDLTLPTPPQALSSDRTKLVVVSLVVGLIVTASMITILESMRRRRVLRRQRRAAQAAADAGPDLPPVPVPSAAAAPLGWSRAGATAG